MARRPTSLPFLALIGFACLAPALFLIAALGTRAGVWGVEVGYDLLTLRIAFGLSFVGALAAIGAGVLAAQRRGAWSLALAAVVMAVATLGGFGWHMSRTVGVPGEDVSTDLAEVPGFGPLASRRGQGGPVSVQGADQCPGARHVATQALPEAVVYVLQREGFAIDRAGVTGVYGSREGFWFGFTNDVVVRIRPGRTDIRVAARDARPHGGEACRVLTRIADELRAGG